MLTRYEARYVLGEICSYDVRMTFRVEGDRLIVKPSVPLNDHQRCLITDHKQDLIDLLTIPPAIPDRPCRDGHVVDWVINEYGIWLCRQCVTARQAIVKAS